MSDIEFTSYVRRPFAILAVQITADNIDELAKKIGEVKKKGEEKFIALDRRVVPNVNRAYIGWYVTQLGGNLRCYAPKVFKEQFMPMPDTFPVSFTHEELQIEEITSVS